MELYTLDNIESPPIHKEELSNLRHFRIEGLKRRDYILKVVPTGQNVYKYNSSVTQLSLAADQDPVLTRISEKHLNLTLYRLEYKTVAASKYVSENNQGDRTQMFTLLAIVGIILAVYYCAPKLHSRDFPAPPPKKDKRAGKK